MNTLKHLFIVAKDELAQNLAREIRRAGFTCYIAGPDEDVSRIEADLALVGVDDRSVSSDTQELCRRLKLERHLPLIALLNRSALASLNGTMSVLPCDDFILEPYDRQELVLRIKKLLAQSGHDGERIECGDLVIDAAQAEVFLNGWPVELAFREYELLRFLASHAGRVYSRDALLNHVWGYDYFGGDRTVDVHIRRLRSKIEDAEHSFIDTVRNMGYRFKKQDEKAA